MLWKSRSSSSSSRLTADKTLCCNCRACCNSCTSWYDRTSSIKWNPWIRRTMLLTLQWFGSLQFPKFTKSCCQFRNTMGCVVVEWCIGLVFRVGILDLALDRAVQVGFALKKIKEVNMVGSSGRSTRSVTDRHLPSQYQCAYHSQGTRKYPFLSMQTIGRGKEEWKAWTAVPRLA